MKIRNVSSGLFLAFVALALGQEATRMGGSGPIVNIDTGKRELTVALKQPDGTSSSTVFAVSENCRITTGGIGVLSELQAGQTVKLDYTTSTGSVLTAEAITYTPPAKPATAPAKKPAAPAKKAAPKKSTTKKSDPKKK